VLERLQILVDGNASGAIREFQKVGASADRELGRAEDKVAKLSAGLTSYGTAAVAGASVAAVGLSKLANSAADYGEALNKATVIVGDKAVKQLEDFAESASKTAGISKTAALDAASGFAALGKQAGLTGDPLGKFSTDLVQLAGDLASFNNTTVDESLQALKSGLQGETEPLKRFNIFLNDAALKQEYFALTGKEVTGTLTQQQKVVAANSLIFKQAGDAVGDFGRTSDSLANRQRQLQADFENLKTTLGQGLVPVFETIVGGVGKVTTAFAEASPETQKLAGTIGGIGIAAVGVTGGIALIAGQALRLREAFTVVSTDGVRSFTKLGKAIGLLGGIAGGIAGLTILDQVLSSASTNATDLAKGINDIIGASSNAQALDALIEQTRRVDGAWEDFKQVFGEDLGLDELGSLTKINGVTVDLNNLEMVLDDLARSQNWPALTAAINALRNAQLTPAPDDWLLGGTGGQEGVDRAIGLVNKYQGQIDSANRAQGAAANGADGMGGAIGGTVPPVEEATNAFKDYADALRASTDPFFAVIDAGDKLTEANQKVAEAFFALADGATPEELQAFAQAQRDAVQAGLGLQGALALVRAGLDDGTISAEQANLVLDQLAAAYPELAGAIAQVRAEFGFVGAAAAALPPTVPLQIQSNVGDVANQLLFLDAIGKRLKSEGIFGVFDPFGDVPNNPYRGGGGIEGLLPGAPRRAAGGPVAAGTSYLVGEEGPEMFTPSSNGRIIPNGQLGGGDTNQTFNIYSTDPQMSAIEVVRRQRDAAFLVGVS